MTSSPHRPGARRRTRPNVAPWLAVLGGGLIGSAVRAGVGFLLPGAPGSVPVATLTVNLLGSLLLGFYLARRERATTLRWSVQFWAIGVLGSLTTFSTFSVDVVRLLQADRPLLALGYATASVAGGLALALFGERIGSLLP